MNHILIENWNKVVKPEDLVWHLGDFAWRHDQETMANLVNSLNGHKYLILGNHDYDKMDYVEWWMKCGFEFVSKYPVILEETIILSHNPIFLCDDNKGGLSKPDLQDSNIKQMVNFHGHTHQNYYANPQYFNCCVELHNYTPINFDAVIADMKKKNNSINK